MQKEFLYKDITEKIIKCFYNVYDELGDGFLESVYEKAFNDRTERIWTKT